MDRKRTPIIERFWPKVRKADGDGCWEWQASRMPKGYGRLGISGVMVLAHRVSYELNIGPIQAGLFVLHKCDNPSCVRPDHLFLGTQADNVHDAKAKGRKFGPQRKSHCVWGHALSEYQNRQVCWVCRAANRTH